MHESRHLHAMRRPRGPGGRFLTAAEIAALEERGELNNNNDNGDKSTGGSTDISDSNSINNATNDNDSNSDVNNYNGASGSSSNGHYFPATVRTGAPSQPAHGFKSMPGADGQRVVNSYQA